MAHSWAVAVFAGVGFALASPTLGPDLTPQRLDQLDPSRLAASLCADRSGPGALARRLMFAEAVAAPASAAGPIPLYDDLTRSPFPVTTSNPEARRYFSQGLLMSYGFNHAGAVRSFREAQRRDPDCAMCWWGEAVGLGPNINAPMDDRDRGAALDALDRAMALRTRASPLEQALIEALDGRYSRNARADRATLDNAYAEAMLDVAERFPANDDVAVLAAEAVMDTSPWNYWEADRKTPVGRIGEAIRLVDTVIRRNPSHVQASHLYIHLLEAADAPRAEAAADRLSQDLAPSAAHLVHMPSHIYQVRGRYKDAIRVNVAAARADEAYIRTAGDHGLVRYGYYPHNVHFIVAAAQMAGDMPTAIDESRRLRKILDPATSARIAWVQAIDAAPYFAMAQFAAPKDILAMPEPDRRLPYPAAMRRYARAIAYAQLRDKAGFDRELAAMEALAKSDVFAGMIEQGVPAPDLLALAGAVARGRFAAAQGRYDDAVGHYRKAVELEGGIPYQEPAYWYYPVRQSLGAAQYLAGRPGEAAETFRAALVQTPNNGWALYGLAESEAALGRKIEAAAARRALARAWVGRVDWLNMARL